ncbi:disulfide bond formation protein B [Massilia sp. S19_KUP03_FR1]|uniref:disulfide bond formation protein B n=1 Tax=Massilia sp. S19_KUP03_FR1 TaxID=3025503 RepID=UPI002FCD9CDF
MTNTRPALLTIAFTALALVGAALYLQHVKDMLPCPLCVLQRYAFLGIALFSLVGAFTKKPVIGTTLALLSGLGGLGVVGKHLYVIANPGFSCGIDPLTTTLNKIPSATMLPWLFKADGWCEATTDTVLGLSVPQWSAIWFVALTLALAWLLLRRRAR